MQIRENKKLGTVQTELAVSLGLCTLALFIVMGAFNIQINQMMTSNSSRNMFNQQNTKTSYNTYNRDYSSSQVDANH